ncbi:UNVERIFIED_CONTAM: hypothetical protein RMT77_012974 [Armadillidium vulgare]
MTDIPSNQLASFGYYVGYKLMNSSDPVKYETKHPSSASLYRQEAILTTLESLVLILLLCKVLTRLGQAPRVLLSLPQLTEDVPDEAPSDIFCSSLSSTSFIVKWKPPNPSYINGILRGYELFYEIGGETKKQSIVGTSATVSGLTPYTNYSVSLSAFTRVGSGIKSDPIFCLTDEDAPGPVTRLKGLSVDKSSILVSWMPPDQPNGVILKYSLTMKRHQPLSSFSSLQSSDWILPFPASHSVVDSAILKFKGNNNNDNNNNNNNNVNSNYDNDHVDNGIGNPFLTNQRRPRVWYDDRRNLERSWIIPGHEHEYLIGDLNERTSYSFNVRASTIVGEGPAGASVTQKPRPDPPAAISSFSRDLSAPWGEELKLSCKVVGIPTPTRQWLINGKEFNPVTKTGTSETQQLPDGTLLLRKVKLNNEGNYTCRVSNEHGKDQITYRVKVKSFKGIGRK